MSFNVGKYYNTDSHSVNKCVERLLNDQMTIVSNIGIDTNAEISNINEDASDKHNGGNTVHIITFTNNQKLVYKPHNMGIDVAWNAFVTYLHREYGIDFTVTPITLDMSTYGWCSFIEHKSIKNPEEIETYYKRCGMLMAVTYILGSNDLHCENIVASGTYPTIIDTETLINGVVKSFVRECDEYRSDEYLRTTVVGSGLLPKFKQINSDDYVDVGGLTGYIDEHINMPISGEKVYDINVYSKSIINGFEEVYDIIKRNKKRIASSEEFNKFAKCYQRVLIRNTQTYCKIINQIHNAKSEVQKENVLQCLKIAFEKYAKPVLLPNLLRIYEAERRSIKNDDIPIFYVHTSEKHLYSEDRIENINCEPIYKCYLSKSPFESSLETLNSLSDQDKALQIDLINASLYAYRMQNERYRVPKYRKHRVKQHHEDSIELLRTTVLSIVHDIDTRRVLRSPYPDWIVYQNDPSIAYCGVNSIGLPMYAGSAGIALIYAAIGSAIYDKDMENESKASTEYALAIYNSLRYNYFSNIDAGSLSKARYLGWANGAGGILVLMCELYTYVKKGKIERKAIDNECSRIDADINYLLSYILNNDMNTGMSDVMTGTAGFLCALDRADEIVNKSLLSKLSVKYGSFLLEERIEWDGKLLWLGDKKGRPLTGYGHGMSGMATACAVTYCYTHDVKYLNAMYQALEYEELNYSYDEKAWPDYRQDTKEIAEKESSRKKHYMYGWCNGAPGIGLAQLKIVDLLKKHNLNEEAEYYQVEMKRNKILENAIESVKSAGLLPRDSLCCGNSSAIDFMTEAACISDEYLHYARDIALDMIVRKDTGDGNYAIDSYQGPIVGNIGLFQGTAGIGYAMLRAAYPKIVRSILI